MANSSSRVVIVTGAAGNLGRAIVDRFARRGATVVATDLEMAERQPILAEMEARGHDVTFLPSDVGDASSVEELVASTIERFGRIDVLVNNAGAFHAMVPMIELDPADFDRIFRVNLKGVFYGVKYAAPYLVASRGNVVNVASISGKRPRIGTSFYAASKAALINLTKTLALELAPFVRVNAVAPVAVSREPATASHVQQVAGLEAILATIPLGRMCSPTDVAASVEFLASDDASFLTGVALEIDGGRAI
jgi:3-oxoacyl-[acyl-carrier protein] reductase